MDKSLFIKTKTVNIGKLNMAIVRFFTHVHIYNSNNSCWTWIGNKNKQGYGYFGLNGKTWKAHRLVWVFAFGKIPGGIFVLHKCDNPMCVNPSHLFLGTHKDNMDDMVAKGRAVNPKKDRVACKNGHLFSKENTRYTPKLSDNNKVYINRFCRVCDRELAAQRYALVKLKRQQHV